MPVKQAVISGSRANVIKALNDLETDWPLDHSRPKEVRASVPFGAGLRTAYADWLLEAAKDDSSWLRTSSVRSQLKAKPKRKLELEVPTFVVPVSQDLCREDRYSLLWRKRWRASKWHINVKEAMVCLSSLRRTARVRQLHGKFKLTLADNLAALCALERGRSSSFPLSKVCRSACAYQMACDLRWRLRHIETMRNPADKDSRFHERKGSGRTISSATKTQPEVRPTDRSKAFGASAVHDRRNFRTDFSEAVFNAAAHPSEKSASSSKQRLVESKL